MGISWVQIFECLFVRDRRSGEDRTTGVGGDRQGEKSPWLSVLWDTVLTGGPWKRGLPWDLLTVVVWFIHLGPLRVETRDPSPEVQRRDPLLAEEVVFPNFQGGTRRGTSVRTQVLSTSRLRTHGVYWGRYPGLFRSSLDSKDLRVLPGRVFVRVSLRRRSRGQGTPTPTGTYSPGTLPGTRSPQPLSLVRRETGGSPPVEVYDWDPGIDWTLKSRRTLLDPRGSPRTLPRPYRRGPSPATPEGRTRREEQETGVESGQVEVEIGKNRAVTEREMEDRNRR